MTDVSHEPVTHLEMAQMFETYEASVNAAFALQADNIRKVIDAVNDVLKVISQDVRALADAHNALAKAYESSDNAAVSSLAELVSRGATIEQFLRDDAGNLAGKISIAGR